MIKLVELLNEVMKKVGDKYVVYSKKGGKRLGTHASKAKAKKQLAAIEISKKARMNEDFSDIEELDVSEFEPTLKAIFAKKYPDSKLHFLQSDFMYISTDEEDPEAASMWGSGKKGEYYLALNVYIENGELNILIANASAGNYKGVTSDFLRAIFNKAKQSHGPISKSILAIKGDSSGGRWEQIASKLGVKYQDADEENPST